MYLPFPINRRAVRNVIRTSISTSVSYSKLASSQLHISYINSLPFHEPRLSLVRVLATPRYSRFLANRLPPCQLGLQVLYAHLVRRMRLPYEPARHGRRS